MYHRTVPKVSGNQGGCRSEPHAAFRGHLHCYTRILWLTVPLIIKANSAAHSDLQILNSLPLPFRPLTPSPPLLQGRCDYLGSTRIIQDHLPISGSLTKSHLYVPFAMQGNITHSLVLDIGPWAFGHYSACHTLVGSSCVLFILQPLK